MSTEDNKHGESEELRDTDLNTVAGGVGGENPPPDEDERDPTGSDSDDPNGHIPPNDGTEHPSD